MHTDRTAPQVTFMPESLPDLTLFAIGDAGAVNAQSQKILQDISFRAESCGNDATVVFLGDNVYPDGFPTNPAEVDFPEKYEEAVMILMSQVLGFADLDHVEVVFVPGNHDWKEGKPDGYIAMRQQYQILGGSGPNNKAAVLPANACGDPSYRQLDENHVIIFLDSQWWIQKWPEDSEEMLAPCHVKSREQMADELRNLVRAHHGKTIILAMHHPCISSGPHGGYFTLRDHLFPLSKVVKWLYLPLPVIGSIYPWYRTTLGHPQDTRHPRYKSLIRVVEHVIRDEPNVILLAGHEHSLQRHEWNGIPQIISGSGSKQNGVAKSKTLKYGHKAPGYFQLDFYPEGVLIRIWEWRKGKEGCEVVDTSFYPRKSVAD